MTTQKLTDDQNKKVCTACCTIACFFLRSLNKEEKPEKIKQVSALIAGYEWQKLFTNEIWLNVLRYANSLRERIDDPVVEDEIFILIKNLKKEMTPIINENVKFINNLKS